jgi:hypothetical protein
VQYASGTSSLPSRYPLKAKWYENKKPLASVARGFNISNAFCHLLDCHPGIRRAKLSRVALLAMT